MANQDYTIDAVSPKIDEWESQYGPMRTYYVKINGNTVKLNKKPDSPAPTKGETLYGYIQPSQYGDQFKTQKKPFAPGGFKADPDKQNQIKAQWAIGQAVSIYNQMSAEDAASAVFEQVVEENATKLFAMVDRVKNGTTTGSTAETPQTTGTTSTGNFRQNTTEQDEKTVVDFDEDAPINLDDIPF